MTAISRIDLGHSFSVEALPRLSIAFLLLGRAYQSAQAAGTDLWEHPVSGVDFQSAGLTAAALHWLIDHGYIEQRLQNDSSSSSRRSRTRNAPNVLSEHAAYVATPQGAEVAIEFIHSLDLHINTNGHSLPASPHGPAELLPHWDRHTRELRYGNVLVKHFRKAAPNQALVLSAFEELGWPERIDDPLPRKAETVPAARLHDTINKLNGSLQAPLIRFCGDGTGQGVCWRRTSLAAETQNS